MTFSRVNALGWTDDFSTITAAQINGLDVNMTSALDGLNGGYYTPTAELAIGGQGLHIWDGSLTIGDGAGQNGTINVSDSSGMIFASGSGIIQSAGSSWGLSGSTWFYSAGVDSNGGAGHHVVNGGVFYVDNGATVKVRTGGTLQVVGTFVASSGSEVRLYDETRQYSGEFIVNDGVPMTLHGDVTIKSDGTLVTEAGSTTTLGGTHNVTGTLQTSGTGAITVKAGGSFTSEALATVSHAGDVEVGGTLTVSGEFVQTGTLTKSGTGAMTGLRVGSTANADGTYGAEKDIWLIGAFNEHTYTLRSSTSPVPVEGTTLRFVCTAQLIGNMHFAREDTSVVANLPLGTDYVWVEFVYHSGSWYFAGGSGVN